nr:hypothetical protein HK105_000724 [Polyrhizophydium stewartii]
MQLPPSTTSDAARAVRFRPSATNEWDRMPAEIQNMILDAAGPFTKFVNGLLLAANLWGMTGEQRIQLWQDAIDVDWQGDLKLLPDVDITSDSLRMSRSIWVRIKDDFYDFDVRRIAIRNCWVDLIDFDDEIGAASAAAFENAVWLLEDVIDVRKLVKPIFRLAEDAALFGQLEALKFLHERMQGQPWRPSVGEKAANSGNLDLVVWLSEHRPECFDASAFEGAAWGDHIHIARWLAEKFAFACDLHAFDCAARNNNFSMIQFLEERFPQVLENMEPEDPFVSSDIRVLEWLQSRNLIVPREILQNIAGDGKIDVLEWAMARFRTDLQEDDLIFAHNRLHNHLLKWAYHRGVPFTLKSAEWAADKHNADLMAWLISRDAGLIPLLAEATAGYGGYVLMEWWREQHGVVFGQRELEAATRKGNMPIARRLLALDDAEWDLDAARFWNEWDRMPAEIQNDILERAGLLTLWINDRIDDAKLDVEKFKSILVEVFGLDWKGDLTTLPFNKFDFTVHEPFWRLRSRSMHARLKALGFSNLNDGLEQAAILNGWNDLLNFHVSMLEHLVQKRKIVALNKEHVRLAATFGRLNVLKWLASRVPDDSWTTTVMDFAASNGHLDVVKWLHANRNEGCSVRAIDWAANNGHLDVVKWLHENRTEGCTSQAMDSAAEKGHLALVQFLHSNRTEGCSKRAMVEAASNGHLAVVKWLHNNRTEGCSARAIDWAASHGHLDCVKWLHENRTEGCSAKAMDYAALHGHLDVVEYLHEHHTEGCTGMAMEYAAENGHVDIVEFLHKNRTECSIVDAAKTAAQFGQLAVIKRIHSLAPDAITVAAVDAAASNGQISVFEWIINEAGVQPTADILTCAVESGRFRILSWFRRRMPEILRSHAASKVGNGSADAAIEPADVMRLAIKERQVMVLKWLLCHLRVNAWHDGDFELARKLVGTK